MTEARVAIVDLARRLRVRKQRIFKLLPGLGVQTEKERSESGRGQVIATVSASDAARIEQRLQAGSSRGTAPADPFDPENEIGVFYIIALEPTHDPGRFKVGFTTDLPQRLRKHRTAAPFSTCSRSWPAKRYWERAAIDAVTQGCEQLHTEVFRAETIEGPIARGEAFFKALPTPSRK